MSGSLRSALAGAGAFLAASAATFGAAVAITNSSTAFAASADYSFEVVQAAPAGPGNSDVTVRLVRTANGEPVANVEISVGTAITSVAEPAGARRFRIETPTAGLQAVLVSARVPGVARVERTFNSSLKFWQERTIRSEDSVVTGVVTFSAR